MNDNNLAGVYLNNANDNSADVLSNKANYANVNSAHAFSDNAGRSHAAQLFQELDFDRSG
jgi:hypothetical protein